mgnify:CR=1 FL=1
MRLLFQKDAYRELYDYYFQLFATAPFLQSETIKNCYNKLIATEKYDSCFTHVLLNVSHIHNLIYSVKISLKNPIQFNNKYYSAPYGREIGIYKNNNIRKNIRIWEHTYNISPEKTEKLFKVVFFFSTPAFLEIEREKLLVEKFSET